ncbi:hypothetical protein K8R43_03450 [archaeon]|nr:hypothetical protein [archaeon]
MKKLLVSLVLAAMLVVGIQFAAAAVPGGATVTSVANATDDDGPAVGTFAVQSGYIHDVNLSTEAQTFKWAGLVGDVSGTIYLNDSSENTLFSWAGAEGAFVYAANDTVAWASLSAANVSRMPSYLTTAAADRWANTYTGSSTFSSNYIGTVLTVPSVVVNSTWTCYSLLEDVDDDLVWAVNVDEGGAVGYNGTTYDYQLLIPEDGTLGNTATQTYHIYVELL